MKRLLSALLFASLTITSSSVLAMNYKIDVEEEKKKQTEHNTESNNTIVPFGDINFLYQVYNLDWQKLDVPNHEKSFDVCKLTENNGDKKNPLELDTIIFDKSREFVCQNPVWDTKIIDITKIKKFIILAQVMRIRFKNQDDFNNELKILKLQLAIPKNLQKTMVQYMSDADFINKFFQKVFINNNYEIVQLFTTIPKFLNQFTIKNINDLFKWACTNNHDKIVQLFIDTLELCNKLTIQNINDTFYLTCVNGHDKIVQLFIDTLELCNKLTIENINIAFWSTCSNDNDKIAQLFIDTPKLLNQLTKANINNIFWLTCIKANYKVVQLFFENNDLAKKLTAETLKTALKQVENKEIKKLIQKHLDEYHTPNHCTVQ